MTTSEIGTIKNLVFDLYNNQNVLSNNGSLCKPNSVLLDTKILALTRNIFILLKPLSMITFEDAVGMLKIDNKTYGTRKVENLIFSKEPKYLDITYSKTLMGGGFYYHFTHGKNNLPIENGTLFIHEAKHSVIDYLRQKGYAVPYLDLSVNDLVELGIINLVETVGFGDLDIKIEKPNTFDNISLFDKVKNFISDLNNKNDDENEIQIESNNTEKLNKFSDDLPDGCVQGWETNMYCSGNNKCKMCITNFTIK